MKNQNSLQVDPLSPVRPSSEVPALAAVATAARPSVQGKFIFVGKTKLWIKGVTYGTFRPDGTGLQYPQPEQVAEDFQEMVANGINAIRTYTVPPRWLLDEASRRGLYVMVGIPWEQHITFLDDGERVRSIEEKARAAARCCAHHPAVLCYSVGNEIPASIVRWHGRKRIERFIARLYRIIKEEDPQGLVTYVNFPTTEYLQLPFLDFLCFNVYLESQDRLEAYLARLQNLSDERPLLIAEIGLDSRRHGEQAQADSLTWQIHSVFKSGCVGGFVFAWTDEWYRGGHDIEDWDFGLTTRERRAKPALSAVARAFADAPFPPQSPWPGISVVICSYNGAATIRDTLDGLQKLSYPDYEVILVNDGSTDETPLIAKDYDVKLISTENRGLSNARNSGYQAASKEIVAYIDDDAYPDPDWAHYLALRYLSGDYAAVGGPNLAPAGDGPIADCVANAPGGPVHVLLADTVAEHIPGCNMSFKRSALVAVGGFDPRYRAAGDDVDLCWRIQEQVGKIGFHAAATVWHHRRNSMQMYWKQQQGYGKAEALLEEKWPQKYNQLGHTSWGGRLYGKGLTLHLRVLGGRVYQGVWGSAPFQSLYQPAAGTLLSLPLMPEWYLLIALLGALSLLGLGWPPLGWIMPVFLMAVALPVAQALLSASRAKFTSAPKAPAQRLKLYAITALMHLQQPLARLIGRLRHGLTPWRKRIASRARWRLSYGRQIWSEQWQAPEIWLQSVVQSLKKNTVPVLPGGDFDDWDLELRGGLLGAARARMAVEEHGAGRQMVRFRVWPRLSLTGLVLGALCVVFAGGAAWDGAWVVASLFALGGLLVFVRALWEYVVTASALWDVLEQEQGRRQAA